MNDIPLHPVQRAKEPQHVQAFEPQSVTLRAYEVYSHLYGEQRAMVEGPCRGGFGASEIIAFLYARSFPKEQWRDRVDEAFKGMVAL